MDEQEKKDELLQALNVCDRATEVCFNTLLHLAEVLPGGDLTEEQEKALTAAGKAADLASRATADTIQYYIHHSFYNSLSKLEKLNPVTGKVYREYKGRMKGLKEISKELDNLFLIDDGGGSDGTA